MSNVFGKSDATIYDLSNLSVLLVEDSKSMQSLTANILRTFGVGDVLVCDGAQEATGILTVTQARKKGGDVKNIDIVLTDWLMPKGSGVELIDWIRGHDEDAIKFLPIVLISAYTTKKVVATARDHGANESLVKPVSGAKLAKRIMSVIDHPRPFISAPRYFGPDRRRRDMPFKGPEKRQKEAEVIQVNQDDKE